MIDRKSTLKQVNINALNCTRQNSATVCHLVHKKQESQWLQPQHSFTHKETLTKKPAQTNTHTHTHSCTERDSTNTGTHRSTSTAIAPEEPAVPGRVAVVSASEC